MLKNKLSDIVLCAFDIETSGGYPLESEVCEIAAVKWHNGKIIESYQTLIKPEKKMSDFIISIHGITNEMVANAPKIQDKIAEFHQFVQNTICVAHHAPFDLGFLSIEYEKKGLMPPPNPVLCTSLLARKLFPESTNHKLQTLVEFFKFEKNTAHRAYDDAISCLNVALKCLEKIGWDKNLEDAIKTQERTILWQNFYLQELKRNPAILSLMQAIQENKKARIIYKKNSTSKLDEVIIPHGLVRSPDGDFLFAYSDIEKKVRRFYLDRILESEVLSS